MRKRPQFAEGRRRVKAYIVRVTDDEHKALARWAEGDDVSVSEMARRALAEFRRRKAVAGDEVVIASLVDEVAP